jgi:hypothetical protein
MVAEPSFIVRLAAMRIAVRVARAPDPAEAAKKRKVAPGSLCAAYALALSKYLETECVAAAEDKADQDVSVAQGWKSLAEIRREKYNECVKKFGESC